METRDAYGDGGPGQTDLGLDRTPLLILVLLLIVAAVQFARYYNLVPDTLATHFGMTGQPNGWTSKTGFVATMGAIEAAFVVGAFLFVKFAAKIPTSSLNIPNKDYWLEPARKDGTLRFVWGQILWIETVTVAFLIAVTESVFRANIADTPSLPTGFFYVMAAFVLVIGWMSVRILFRFRRHSP